MTPWLHIVGIGEDGVAGLKPAVQTLVGDATVLVGGQRHLDMVDSTAEKISWGKGLNHGIDEIRNRKGQQVVVLASGDPQWFGIGVTLLRHFVGENVRIYPHSGAFSLTAARMGWALQNVECLTVHGRSLSLVNRVLRPGQKVLILSRDGKTPRELAELLTLQGYGESVMTVWEHLDGVEEKSISALAWDWTGDCADLNTIALEVVAGPDARRMTDGFGLDDDLFSHDGQLTKREIRAVTLSSLAPRHGETLWDIGAGCGSVAIEWMRVSHHNKAIAVEHNGERRQRIATNAHTFGVPGLEIIAAKAPDGLGELALPDAIFIGGGVSIPGLLERCWQALKPGGRLVANAVTLEAEREIMHFADIIGGRLCRIAISREDTIGRMRALKPLAPVLQLVAVKD